jgi:hypothetical protein
MVEGLNGGGGEVGFEGTYSLECGFECPLPIDLSKPDLFEEVEARNR